VDQVLSSPYGTEIAEKYGHSLVVDAIRSILDQVRQDHLKEESAIPDLAGVLDAAENLIYQW
jgi:hypothetical protein